MKEFVICFIKISELEKRDIRIPSESIDAVYKITSASEVEAREKAGEMFLSERPQESLSEYIVSCGSSQ